MGVSFYRKGKRRGKELAMMGYGKFNFIRAIFQACWDPQFGLDYYSWEDRKWSDAHPSFPKAMLDLFAQPDCEGELSNEQCKAICSELEKNDTFMQRKPFTELSRPSRYSSRAWTNTWMNEPEWRDEAEKFYKMLKDCAKRGCGIEWF